MQLLQARWRGTPRSRHWFLVAMVLETSGLQLLQARWRGTPRSRHLILRTMAEKVWYSCCRRVGEEHHAHDTGSWGQSSWRSRGCSCCRSDGEELLWTLSLQRSLARYSIQERTTSWSFVKPALPSPLVR